MEPLVHGYTQPATVIESSGISRDGWCERVVSLQVAAGAAVSICQLALWLKPEARRDCSRFSVRFGDSNRFTFDAPHDRLIVVQAACRGDAGEIISGILECDNTVEDKGSDIRALSFRLDGLHFA